MYQLGKGTAFSVADYHLPTRMSVLVLVLVPVLDVGL
jgi:hypothetical protein